MKTCPYCSKTYRLFHTCRQQRWARKQARLSVGTNPSSLDDAPAPSGFAFGVAIAFFVLSPLIGLALALWLSRL